MAQVSKETVEPRWALLLFDTDGRTIATRTSSLDVDDRSTIRPNRIIDFRFGKDTLLAEILTLADTKEDLGMFELDWELTCRFDAIEQAKRRGDVNGYLFVHQDSDSDLESPSAPSSFRHFVELEGRIEESHDVCLQSSNSEIMELKENQRAIMKNQSEMLKSYQTLSHMILNIRDHLQAKLEKARQHYSSPSAISVPLQQDTDGIPPQPPLLVPIGTTFTNVSTNVAVTDSPEIP